MQVCGNQAPVDKYGMIEYVLLPLILVMWVLVSCTAFSLQHAHESCDANRAQHDGNTDASLACLSPSANNFAPDALLAQTQNCVSPVRGGLAVASVAVLALVCERETERQRDRQRERERERDRETERERETDRQTDRQREYVCVCVCMCVYI